MSVRICGVGSNLYKMLLVCACQSLIRPNPRAVELIKMTLTYFTEDKKTETVSNIVIVQFIFLWNAFIVFSKPLRKLRNLSDIMV